MVYVFIDYVIRLYHFVLLSQIDVNPQKNIGRVSRQEKLPRENTVIRGNNVSVPEEAADDVDANIDRLLRGELPAGTTTEHNDSLLIQVFSGLLLAFFLYAPFWSGNGGVFSYLNEQTVLFTPTLFEIPDDIHYRWESGEYKGYEYDAKVTFPDELPFDIIRRIPQNFLSFSIDIEHIIGRKNNTIDFDDERLHRLIKPLLPFYLKVGGKEADRHSMIWKKKYC